MLKKYVRNKANPEGCIAFGYIYDEALGFCTEYFRWYPHTRHRMWAVEEEEIDIGEVLVGKGKHKKLTIEELKAIHEYIITNSITIEIPYK